MSIDIEKWPYHKKFPNGKFYLVNPEAPRTPLCAGAGGTCGNVLDLSVSDHIMCACCRASLNLYLAAQQADRLYGPLPTR